MMISTLIILLLILGAYRGSKRGLLLELLHIVGFIASIWIASQYYLPVSKWIEMYIPYPSYLPDTVSFALFTSEQALVLDQVFYKAVAFIGILIVCGIIINIIGYVAKELGRLPIINEVNTIGGAVLGVVSNYITLFFLLSVVSLLPLEGAQKIYKESAIATYIVEKTPYFTEQVAKWWSMPSE